MKLIQFQAAIGTAILLLSSPCDAKHPGQLSYLEFAKRHSHRRAHTSPRADGIEGESLNGSLDGMRKRRGSCAFPTNAGLVAVTPGSLNAGWAMSPDQACTPNSYCPYACPPGEVMAQWSPDATSYTYPESMAGGLYCDSNGDITKPFPSQPYCVSGTGTVNAQNNAGSVVSFCQTVLPGNEAMLIPTSVEETSVLAVPGTSYWCETAAHYYINAPGISTIDACIWGDGSKALGNWSPYVAGANTDASGNTFVKIGWNPIFTGCSLSNTKPTFGVKIVCSGSGCNGTPCSIDPSVDGVGGVTSSDQAAGAGGANFCVVTVPPGQTASIVVFNAGDSSSSSSGSKAKAGSASSSTTPAPTSAPTTAKAASSSMTHASTTSTTKTQPSTSPVSSYEPVTLSSSTSAITLLASSSIVSTSYAWPSADNSPHVFFENATTTLGSSQGSATGTGGVLSAYANTTATGSGAISTTTKKSSAPESMVSGSIFSFLVLFTFASYAL